MPLLDLYSLWTGPPFTPSTSAATVAQLSVLYAADILMDGVAASTEGCSVSVTLQQQLRDQTAFGDLARWWVPALYEVTVRGEFFYQSGDGLLSNHVRETSGSTDLLVLAVSPDLAVGDIVSMFRVVNPDFTPHADYGEIIKADLSSPGGGNGRCVQGQRLLRAAQSGTSGLGQAVQLGAVTSAQRVYGTLNVIGTTQTPAGTVFSVVSSPTSDLATTTTRLTFTAGTSVRDGEWQEVAGAVTDTWWAAKWTGFSGTSFTASVAAGIE